MLHVIGCPYCGYGNADERIFCERCGRKIRSRRLSLALPLMLPIFMFLVLFLVKLPVHEKVHVWENETYPVVREIPVTYHKEEEHCSNRSYRLTVSGGNVDSGSQFAIPDLKVTNLEPLPGHFLVNFSFINENRFPYTYYGGPRLASNLRAGIINKTNAEFYSPNYDVYILPNETIEIRNATRKPRPGDRYWGIATVIEPSLYECSNISRDYVIIENRSVMASRPVLRDVDSTVQKRAADLVWDGSYLELIILMLLFAIIVLMLSRMAGRYREKRDPKTEESRKKN